MSLSTLLQELKGTSKPAEKQAILLKHDSEMLRWVIEATYNPFKMYHIKIKEQDIPDPGPFDFDSQFNKVTSVILECLNCLSPKQNKIRVLELLALLNEGSQSLVLGILGKGWESGISSKLILELFPGIFPVFTVQLANKYKDYIKKKKYAPKMWYSSLKLDGVRCVTLRLPDGWSLFSRQGHLFQTTDHLKEQLDVLYNKYGYTFFDGELYKEGMLFEEVQSMATSFTQGTNTEIDYYIFVCGKAEDFLNQKTDSIRIVFNEGVDLSGTSSIHIVEHKLIDESELEQELEVAFGSGYEGIMLRDISVLYSYRRDNFLLKIKESSSDLSQEETSDCIVTGIEYKDKFPVIEGGKIVYKKLLNKLIVTQEDTKTCKVGSGFTLEFRQKYTDTPEELIGRVVEITHQGHGAQGKLRFPRLKRIRMDL